MSVTKEWQAAKDLYDALRLDFDALDWIGTAELTDEQKAVVIGWYKASEDYVTAIDDMLDGLR